MIQKQVGLKGIQGKKLNDKEKEIIMTRFLDLRCQKKLTFTEIAKELNVNSRTLIKWAQSYKIAIQNSKIDEIEKILREENITQDKIIRDLAQDYRRLDEHLKTADLDKFSTIKAMELRLKYKDGLLFNLVRKTGRKSVGEDINGCVVIKEETLEI
jgi:hypothetical protein